VRKKSEQVPLFRTTAESKLACHSETIFAGADFGLSLLPPSKTLFPRLSATD
jgi:hypothetical protein